MALTLFTGGCLLRILALLLALVFWTILSLAIKAEVDFTYKRTKQNDHLEIILRVFKGLLKFKIEIPTIQVEWEKGPQLKMEQTVSSKPGGARKTKTKARLRYVRRGFFYRLWPQVPGILQRLSQIKYQFYRSIHCSALDWRMEIGYENAAYTALAAGALWSGIGVSVARLYRQVSVEVENPTLMVIPQFQKVGFSCEIHCIFHLRLGHIIFAGINLLRTFRRAIRG